MSKLIEGGCLCGAVRYEATAKPDFALHCYCRQCQHLAGAGHASQFALPSASVTLHGKVSTYEMKAESGKLCNERILFDLRESHIQTIRGVSAI